MVHTDCLRPQLPAWCPANWSVPNGIEGIPEPLLAGAALPGQRPPTVLYLGNLVEAKGFLDVMAAVPLVVRAVPGVRFIIAGAYFQPSDREQAERLMQDPRSALSCSFPGW